MDSTKAYKYGVKRPATCGSTNRPNCISRKTARAVCFMVNGSPQICATRTVPPAVSVAPPSVACRRSPGTKRFEALVAAGVRRAAREAELGQPLSFPCQPPVDDSSSMRA
ncbi:hypothetical protein MRX96_034677 [Rhipicephalus microplus]